MPQHQPNDPDVHAVGQQATRALVPQERTTPVDVKQTGTEYTMKFVSRFVLPADVDAAKFARSSTTAF